MLRLRAVPLVGVLALAACAEPPATPLPTLTRGAGTVASAAIEEDPSAALLALGNAVNADLEAQGAAYRVEGAEWLGEDELGRLVVFANRGNKQLPWDFVPGDPRPPRNGRTDITYIVDQTQGAIGLTVAQTTAAIDRAMTTWNSVTCSASIPIVKLADIPGVDLGTFFGSSFLLADITHAGWLPTGVLPNPVIAATFTFIFVSGGVPTDNNNDGAADVAFREIYYNNRFRWRINNNIDVETVALHESGHGLSQAHFGGAFFTLDNLKLHFNPRAVMNAAYSGVQQTLSGTDEAGHCSLWGSWPNK